MGLASFNRARRHAAPESKPEAPAEIPEPTPAPESKPEAPADDVRDSKSKKKGGK